MLAEREEKLKSLFMGVKDEHEKAGLKLNIKKTKITASSPITSMTNKRINRSSSRFYFLGLKMTEW